MKFTLSWLKEHLDTTATIDEVAEAMTMAGLEVEEIIDPTASLKPFSVARIVEAVQHPNADRLRVCQVDTVDGRLEIVCGAPNARAGLTTIYAPLGAYIPGSGITLEPKPVRGVVSHGMLCSAAELEVSTESSGIMELPGDLAVGTPAAQALSAGEPVIDFEVTPNRPDWLGVVGIARDLAAAGIGRLKEATVEPVAGTFPCPVEIRLAAPDACPVFAGRLIRGVRNGPSPQWLQDCLKSVGLRSISALVDVTNLISYDRARPLHVYDAGKLSGDVIVARLGHNHEHLIALDGETYALSQDMCVIADGVGDGEPDGARPIGLGGVMGGVSTGCDDDTTEVFIECAWFDPVRTARTGRATGIASDAQYRFARGVDPASVLPGLELATRLIVELCGGEPSDVRVAGEAPPAPQPIGFDPAYVHKLAGLSIGREGTCEILTRLGFTISGDGSQLVVTPPSWRRDVAGKADLVEEVARIAGLAALPATPLPPTPYRPGGVLTLDQRRARVARRALAAQGYQEAATWSFTSQAAASLFGGGQGELVLSNPIAAELDCMRPSLLPNLLQAVGRNARRGHADVAIFEIGPVFAGAQPRDQRTAIAAVLAPHAPRRWDGAAVEDVYTIKADLLRLLEEIGAPVTSLQVAQGQASPWWRPGRSARVQLGPKTVLAEFGALHPSILRALDVEGPVYGFEAWIQAIPAAKARSTKTRPALQTSALMPLSRDFAFVVEREVSADALVRAVAGADKALISQVRLFDVYQGAGVPEGCRSLAVEVALQPRERTLTEPEIEAVSQKIISAAQKAVGARLRA